MSEYIIEILLQDITPYCDYLQSKKLSDLTKGSQNIKVLNLIDNKKNQV